MICVTVKIFAEQQYAFSTGIIAALTVSDEKAMEKAVVRPERTSAQHTPIRVGFVHAPNPTYSELQTNGVLFMPVWAYTLASHIPDDGSYDLALYDTRFQNVDAIGPADVFLFSGINQDRGTLVHLHTALKRRFPNAVFVIGGPICWSFDQAGDIETLSMFDHIVTGDGEAIIGELLYRIADGQYLDKIIRNADRFPIAKARPLHRPLLNATVTRYYGAVLEVGRGCPFLCEFCDIRVLPDNNRTHNKSPELIVQELDHCSRLGIQNYLLACDTFIGDPRWAEDVLDHIIEWQNRTGFRPSMYTWLTMNLYKYPTLMRKMRYAGFDMLFIGIESFNSNSLLETAKVQNTSSSLIQAIRDIQSYGFFIVGGLIFGFDSDGEDCFDITIRGIRDSGLLSGDPSLLTALPGTPLYRRLKLSGRLRDVRYGLGGHKYQTNIKYLLPRETIIKGFQRFVAQLTEGAYQFERLEAFFDNLERGNFIPLQGKGYASTRDALKTITENPRTLILALKRLLLFAKRPRNLYWFARAVRLVISRPHIQGRMSYLQFWWVLWTTVIMKYQGIHDRDFDVESISNQFRMNQILPVGYCEDMSEPIPKAKIRAQQRYTTRALHALAARPAMADDRS